MKIRLYHCVVLVLLTVPLFIYTQAFLNAAEFSLPVMSEYSFVNILILMWSYFLCALFCLKAADFDKGSFLRLTSLWMGWPTLIIMFFIAIFFNALLGMADGFVMAVFQVITSLAMFSFANAGFVSVELSYYAPQLALPILLFFVFFCGAFLHFLLFGKRV